MFAGGYALTHGLVDVFKSSGGEELVVDVALEGYTVPEMSLGIREIDTGSDAEHVRAGRGHQLDVWELF